MHAITSHILLLYVRDNHHWGIYYEHKVEAFLQHDMT